MTITEDGIDRREINCETMEINGNNSRTQYTIGSNDFIRKYIHDTNYYNYYAIIIKAEH